MAISSVRIRQAGHRRDSTRIANVLVRNFADGRTLTPIAREINPSRSAVSRIIGNENDLLKKEPRAHLCERQAISAQPN
ncbi:hypothetical protein [Nocardia sp. NPDC004860]|uniref:hypothetical protein n=1 Tax=Nocardia sp. NPDC004860 TaxID=3154557 RepID=UPI0033A167C8